MRIFRTGDNFWHFSWFDGFLLVVLLLVIGWLQYTIHYSDYDGLPRIRQLKQAIDQQGQNKDKSYQKSEQIKSSLKQLKEDPQYLEIVARERFFMIKPGEVYVLPVTTQPDRGH